MSSMLIIFLTWNVNIFFSYISKLVEMRVLKWVVSNFSSNLIFIPYAKNATALLLKWLTRLYASILAWEWHLSSKDQLENLTGHKMGRKKKIRPVKIINLRSKTQWAELSLLDQKSWKKRTGPMRTLKDLRRSSYAQSDQIRFELTTVLAGKIPERA